MTAQQESILRINFFIGGLSIFFILGWFFPVRLQPWQQHWRRWSNNILLTITNSLISRVLFGAMLYKSAMWAQQHQVGLMWLLKIESLPVNILISVLVLDLIIYWQHRLFHRLPLLWRLHRLHHSDVEFDCTTALRFHPLEIIFSIFIKLFAVVLFGVAPLSVVIFEVALNFSAMFNHGNFRLPQSIEKITRLFLITPDFHRIHHSINKSEQNSNYGFCLSWWDYLFTSWTARSQLPDNTMPVGLTEFRSSNEQRLWFMLTQPWR